jgi:ketosteroid isomerase-like protein
VKLEDIEIKGTSGMVYAAGMYSLTVHLPGGVAIQDHGKFLDVRRKQEDGSWLIVADAYNSSVPIGE